MSEPIYNKEIRISEETYNRLTELADAYKLSYDDLLNKKIFTKEEGCLLAYQIRLLWETYQFLKPPLADKLKALEQKVLDNTEDGGKSYYKTIKEITK